jgi:hypothetical protein
MKKLIIITLAFSAFIATTSCSNDDDFSGSNTIISQFRDVPAFNKVSSDGIFTVNILQGAEQSLEVIANDNIINRLQTTVSNNKLSIYLLDGNYDNISIEINITVPNLNELQNSGTGNITVIELISEGNINIENSGTGSISISGTVTNLDIRNEGTGNFYGGQFISANANVDIYGSGNCEVYCTDLLNVKIEGSGNVFYKGYPAINVDISGSGEVVNSN